VSEIITDDSSGPGRAVNPTFQSFLYDHTITFERNDFGLDIRTLDLG